MGPRQRPESAPGAHRTLAVRLRARMWGVILLAAMTVIDMGASPSTAATPLTFNDLEGWSSDDHKAAFAAFLMSCPRLLKKPPGSATKPGMGTIEEWQAICRAAQALDPAASNTRIRQFFEHHFRPVELKPGRGRRGLFTGYFEPEIDGSRDPNPDHTVALLRPPDDLVRMDKSRQPVSSDDDRHLPYGRVVNGKTVPYFTRAEIEKGALSGRGLELVYLKSRIDAFFLHVQGSGRIRFSDGSVMRVAFAGKNGHPYTSIGRKLVEWGELTLTAASMGSIRAWLKKTPRRANELLWENRSFIFFNELKNHNAELGPMGAAGVALTPGRSLAVDRRYFMFGVPLWLATDVPGEVKNTRRPWRRLMVAQDTGSAIVGRVRGDIFWGTGAKAGRIAGRMKHPGKLFLLRPAAGL